jgi:two-component system cell cycle sensor histidine kinase/response regulator CckA
MPPMVGATGEQVLSQNFREIPSWKASGLLETADRALSEGLLGRQEIHVTTSFGKEVWLDCRFSPISAGAAAHLVLIVDDITDRVLAERERQHLEAQVQHTQKLESLGILAGGIAHDFNNILTGLLGNAELALRDVPPRSPIYPLLDNIHRAGRRAADLTGQMLAYSGKGRFVVQETDINDLVQDMASLLESSKGDRGELSYALSDGLPGVRADATQLRQILLNLVINASEAVAETGGQIQLSTYLSDSASLDPIPLADELAAGRYVTIQVTDTGCGMDEETQAKVFDPFFTTKFTGRGLGMAAVQGIVRGHKGAIHLESAVGKGTTFRVHLPALDHPAKPVPTKPERDDGWRGRGTILVVDDDEMVRRVACQILAGCGFSVLAAENGAEAVTIFNTRHAEIACVLLDLNMPLMDGAETCKMMRKLDGGVPVILSSGYGEEESTQRFGDQGLAGFIQKPYQVESLEDKLREVLGS